ncbi:EAL domain-containing protein [Ideonella alba]|uniref:EAL domain-containing protein n=1 Tax=Ideonella alba TaxID=2824118 RepID=A0A940YFK3_9BURK|nr:EAL domain-containing protein [Ideonella alba]MBQ0929069.1 EAL domain-containing protein [Ideonella alba]
MSGTTAPRFGGPAGRGWRARAGIALLMALAVGLFAVLERGASAVPAGVHAAYSERLHDVRSLNAAVDRDLLAARWQRNRHYDDLTSHTGQLSQLAGQLAPPPSFLLDRDAPTVAAEADALAAALIEKADLVDQFRRENAVLSNSLNYLDALTRELLDGPAAERLSATQREAIGRYARQLSAGTLGAERHPPPPLTLDGSGVLAEPVAQLRRHGAVLVEREARLDALDRQLLALGTDARVDALAHHYTAGHARAAAQATRYRQALSAVSVLLAGAVGWLLWHLARARRSLQRTHAELARLYDAQLAAQQLLTLHATAFRNAHDGITLTDAQGNILDVNPAFTRITGWTREEVIGRNPRVLKSGYHDDAFYRAMWRSIADTGRWSGEIWNRNREGAIYPELLSIAAVRDAEGQTRNFVAVFADIGHLKHQERQLKQLAYFDALTELPNRKLLAERLGHGIAQARHGGRLLAVCLLDLDGFKPINDQWGHEAGDRVLVEIGQRLLRAVRGGDTVARLGGDEFALLLNGLGSVDEVEEVLRRLIAVVAQPLAGLPQPTTVSASVGVTLFPADDEGPDTLLRHADQAMYQAKQAGKNGYRFFNAEEDRHQRHRHGHVARLADALRQGELVLHYQPQVDLRAGRVVGAEALIRWQHPQRGLLAPGDFLPQIDDAELIESVGDWVIEQALSQLDAWHAAGQRLPVSVNIAGRHLQQRDFIDRLQAAQARHPAVAGLLALEVLETTALEDIVRTARVIDDCRALGVSVALDDFGAGYSSLSYLKRLPIELIKIDLGFVRELPTDLDNLIIVRGVIELARAFGRQVLAEGIESALHGRMLLQLDGDLAQGHGIARAMPAGDWLPWLAAWRPDPSWQAVAPLHWSDTDRQLLTAEIQLRAWVEQVQRAVLEQRPIPHQHFGDPTRCAFGTWFEADGRLRYAAHGATARIDALHRQLHREVDQLDGLWREGRHAAMRAGLSALLAVQDELAAALLSLQLAVGRPREDARP